MKRASSAPFALLLYFTFASLACALRSHGVRFSQLPAGAVFVSASMSLLDIRLSPPSFCCDLSCSCADINNGSVEHCSSVEDRLATQLSPSLCATLASNVSSLTPCARLRRSSILCNGGAGCCSDTCNDSCTSKPDVCACPCEHCSSTCSCCKRVENRRCWQQLCEPCERVWMMLDFLDQDGKPHSVNFSKDFPIDSNSEAQIFFSEAQNFYDVYAGRSSIEGLFRSDDPNIVDVPLLNFQLDAREDYPVPRYWGKFLGTAAVFPIFTISILLTGLLFAFLLQRRRRRADQRPFRIAWSVNRGLWIGIMWPLIILLLIIQFRGFIVSIEATPSILFHQMMICIGWLPLLMMWLYHIMHPHL